MHPMNIANRPNQNYSLEQSRFIAKVTSASRQNDAFYLQELGNRPQPQKEQYVQFLENQNQLNFGEDTRDMSMENPYYRQQLGRTIG